MKILLMICGLAILAAARPNRSHFRKELLRRTRDEKHKTARTSDMTEETCGTALSNATADVLGNLAGIPHAPPIIHKEKTLKAASLRIFGFDMLDDEEERQEAFCKLSGVKDVAGLKTAMDDYDYQLFRLLYDYISIMIPTVPHTAPSFQQLIHTIETLGLARLDPEGVEWCLDVSEMRLYYEMMTAGYNPPPPSGDTLEQKCLTLRQVVTKYIELLFPGDPVIDTMLRNQIRHWTGIDIYDDEQLTTLLCDLLAASQNGLKPLYDVIDGYGIVDQMYETGYPVVVSQARMAKAQLIGLIQFFESILHNHQDGNELPEMYPTHVSNYPEDGSYNKIPHNGPSRWGPPYGGPPHGGHSHDGPQHGRPHFGGPHYGEPQPGGPPYGGPPHGGPHYGEPQPGGPHFGGPQPGGPQPGGHNFGGPQPEGPHYGGTVPGGPSYGGHSHDGPLPGGGEPSPFAILELLRAVLAFFEAMEGSGLLSLT